MLLDFFVRACEFTGTLILLTGTDALMDLDLLYRALEAAVINTLALTHQR